MPLHEMWTAFFLNQPFLVIECLSFRLIGIDIRVPKDKGVLKRPAVMIFLLTGTIIWVVSMICFAVRYIHDVDKVIQNLTILVQCSLAIFKALMIVYHGKRFAELIRNVENLAEGANEIERLEWLAENRQMQMIASIYFCICWSTGFVGALLPFAVTVFRYFYNGNFLVTLPFHGLFPYDYNEPFFFLLSILWSTHLVVYIISALVGVDCLFGWFVHNVSAHFRILHVKLHALALEAVELNGCAFRQRIAQTISYHRNVISLTAEFNAIFYRIILLQITLSCFQMCFFVYQLANGSDLPNIPFIVMATWTILLQLVIYCFGGEKIQNSSQSLSLDIFVLFPWDRLSPEKRRLLLLPLMCAQRPLTITGYFFVVDRPQLVWIFKTATSFTALLLGMRNGT